MQFNYLAFAVPLFISLMILEFFVAKKKGKNFFNFTNSISKYKRRNCGKTSGYPDNRTVLFRLRLS